MLSLLRLQGWHCLRINRRSQLTIPRTLHSTLTFPIRIGQPSHRVTVLSYRQSQMRSEPNLMGKSHSPMHCDNILIRLGASSSLTWAVSHMCCKFMGLSDANRTLQRRPGQLQDVLLRQTVITTSLANFLRTLPATPTFLLIVLTPMA